MTTPLFLLRCKQLGLSMTELDLLTIGLINDMFTERENDEYSGWNGSLDRWILMRFELTNVCL